MKTITAQEIVEKSKAATASADDEPLAKVYYKWLKNKNILSPIGDVSLEPAMKTSAYKVFQDMEGIKFERIKPKTAELYKFDSGPMGEVLSEIDRFWTLRDNYKNLGLMYSRGLLMYGPPGSGKTSIINQVVDLITAKGDIVLYASDINSLKGGIKALRGIEADRQVVAILEDIDEYIKWDEQPLLHLLDGQDTTDSILYLATTNYIDKFPPRLLRSGRFDKKIYVPQPPKEGRKAYFQNKLKAKNLATDDEIDDLVKETEGMSFGDLSEIITAVYALQEPKKEVLSRLNKGKENSYENDSKQINSSPSAIYPMIASGSSIRPSRNSSI
jgi:tRNA uridine 5-carbamoylmethylation protein Kti12